MVHGGCRWWRGSKHTTDAKHIRLLPQFSIASIQTQVPMTDDRLLFSKAKKTEDKSASCQKNKKTGQREEQRRLKSVGFLAQKMPNIFCWISECILRRCERGRGIAIICSDSTLQFEQHLCAQMLMLWPCFAPPGHSRNPAHSLRRRDHKTNTFWNTGTCTDRKKQDKDSIFKSARNNNILFPRPLCFFRVRLGVRLSQQYFVTAVECNPVARARPLCTLLELQEAAGAPFCRYQPDVLSDSPTMKQSSGWQVSLGPMAALRPPTKVNLGPQGPSFHVCHEESWQQSCWWSSSALAEKDLHMSCFSVHDKGYQGAVLRARGSKLRGGHAAVL